MLSQEILDLYKKSRLMTYRAMFGRIREKTGSLSATEAYAVDVIYLLGSPTITNFIYTHSPSIFLYFQWASAFGVLAVTPFLHHFRIWFFGIIHRHFLYHAQIMGILWRKPSSTPNFRKPALRWVSHAAISFRLLPG